MISIREIQLGKSFCLTKLIQQFANQKQRILVFDDYIVKTTIIYTKWEASIWLPIKKDRCSSGELEKPDKAVGQIGFNLGFQLYWG